MAGGEVKPPGGGLVVFVGGLVVFVGGLVVAAAATLMVIDAPD
jgi:hypothetical protein